MEKLKDLYQKLKDNFNLLFYVYAGVVAVAWLVAAICSWSNLSGYTANGAAASVVGTLLNGCLTFAFIGFGVWVIFTQREHLKKIYFVIYSAYALISQYYRGFSGITSLFYLSNASWYTIVDDILYAMMSLAYLTWAVLIAMVVFFKKVQFIQIIKFIMVGIICVAAIRYLFAIVVAIINNYGWRSILNDIFALSTILYPTLLLVLLPENLPGMCGCHKEDKPVKEYVAVEPVEEDSAE